MASERTCAACGQTIRATGGGYTYEHAEPCTVGTIAHPAVPAPPAKS